jgi:hypothetical protein
MKFSATPGFRKRLAALPPEVRNVAIKNYKLWRQGWRGPATGWPLVVASGRLEEARVVHVASGYARF